MRPFYLLPINSICRFEILPNAFAYVLFCSLSAGKMLHEIFIVAKLKSNKSNESNHLVFHLGRRVVCVSGRGG